MPASIVDTVEYRWRLIDNGPPINPTNWAVVGQTKDFRPQGATMGLFYAFTDGSPNGPVYEIQVNKGSINMEKFTKTANNRYANGYKIDKLYEQDGNTIVVWMKRNA